MVEDRGDMAKKRRRKMRAACVSDYRRLRRCGGGEEIYVQHKKGGKGRN